MRYPIIPYNPILKARARRLRHNMTPSERQLWQHLKGKQMLGYDFDRQRPIDHFIVDFYCKALKLAIEVDGGYHDNPDTQIYDCYRQTTLESFGIAFLRFRNAEVHHNIANVLAKIEQWIQTHPPTC